MPPLYHAASQMSTSKQRLSCVRVRMTAKGVARRGTAGYNLRRTDLLFVLMKMLRYVLCCMLVLGMTACTHRHAKPAPSPAPAPTRTVKHSAAPRTTDSAVPAPEAPAQPQQPTGAPPVPQVSPAAPGLRVARVHVPGMYVALTFDDGPSASLTPRVLDILRRNNAVGTFFVLGQNAAVNRSVVARAAAEGNEIGVHTWSHIKMSGSSLAKVDSEVSRTSSLIQEITGRAPLVMRPPYGATNGALVNRMKAQFGMRSILWDVDTLDWRHPGVQKVINTAVGQAKPGSIILVHDIHASTVAAVEGIVQGLQARGFKLVTVSQLIALGNRAAGQGADAAPASAPVPTPAAEETPAPRPAEVQSETTAPAAEVPMSTPAPIPAPESIPAEPAPAPETVPAPAVVPEPLPAIRPATESGAASISATTDAAAEEISAPAAEETPAPAAADGAASIAGQEESL